MIKILWKDQLIDYQRFGNQGIGNKDVGNKNINEYQYQQISRNASENTTGTEGFVVFFSRSWKTNTRNICYIGLTKEKKYVLLRSVEVDIEIFLKNDQFI